jgi:hypothetical protein
MAKGVGVYIGVGASVCGKANKTGFTIAEKFGVAKASGLAGSGIAIGLGLWLWLGWARGFWFCGSWAELGLKLSSAMLPKGEVKGIRPPLSFPSYIPYRLALPLP